MRVFMTYRKNEFKMKLDRHSKATTNKLQLYTKTNLPSGPKLEATKHWHSIKETLRLHSNCSFLVNTRWFATKQALPSITEAKEFYIRKFATLEFSLGNAHRFAYGTFLVIEPSVYWSNWRTPRNRCASEVEDWFPVELCNAVLSDLVRKG